MLSKTALYSTLRGAVDVDAGPVITDLKSCREKILSQRKAVKDTRERWFSAETFDSSAVGESAPRTTVGNSDVVEVGPCSMWLSTRSLVSLVAVGQVPGKARIGNHQRVLVSRKNSFLFPARLLAVLHLNLLFRNALRSRGRGEVVAIAVMPQYSNGDTSNILTV